MSTNTIVSLPDQSTARIPKVNFLTKENGLLSWLLTGDHKRIAHPARTSDAAERSNGHGHL